MSPLTLSSLSLTAVCLQKNPLCWRCADLLSLSSCQGLVWTIMCIRIILSQLCWRWLACGHLQKGLQHMWWCCQPMLLTCACMQACCCREQSDSHAAPAERVPPGRDGQLLGRPPLHGGAAGTPAAHQRHRHRAAGLAGGESSWRLGRFHAAVSSALADATPCCRSCHSASGPG